MKQLNVTFEDEEYTLLLVAKEQSGLGWREFLIALVKPQEQEDDR